MRPPECELENEDEGPDPGSIEDVAAHEPLPQPTAPAPPPLRPANIDLDKHLETDAPLFVPVIDDIDTSLKFIDALKCASLESTSEPTTEAE